jgi:hypothetical protein
MYSTKTAPPTPPKKIIIKTEKGEKIVDVKLWSETFTVTRQLAGDISNIPIYTEPM